ncbi:REST corepressor spr-1 [Ditylenchus destructor]|uniref:REST corepressor spr-1 n=1 Tax=Ditylenchus destructor TaxID=166010 RepID=A0AAD4R410_9BILA|nr:REST corepressor spr-1 [Ditylenchus destructor]
MNGNTNSDNKDAKSTPEQSTRNVATRSSSKRILNASIDGSPSKVSHTSSFCQLPTNQKIREGNEFQAQVPAASAETAVEDKPAETDATDKETCLWKPSDKLGDDDVMEYGRKASVNYGINFERALYILYSSNYDLELANTKLKLQTVFEEHFSEDDQFTFRHALGCYGKNFSKIRQMIPHKSVYALVQHYYSTKKTQNYSTMDADNQVVESDSSEEESKAIDKKDFNNVCDNCHHLVKKVYAVNELELCLTCKTYFKSTNQHRPCRQLERPKLTVCPPDMRNTAKNFLDNAQPVEQSAKFKDADDSGELQIACPKVTKCQQLIEQTKQEIEKVRGNAIRIENTARAQSRNSGYTNLDEARNFLQQTAPSSAKTRLSYTWTRFEKDTAFRALVVNKGNYHVVAEILTTKTADMVKSFYEDHQSVIGECIKKRQKKVQEAINNLTVEAEQKKVSKNSNNSECIDLE